MSRIDQAFKEAKSSLLNIYFTAGYPNLESTVSILQALEEGGADLVELGMPYSDPLADGETIQESSSIALGNGMSISKLFEQLDSMREHISVPVLLMGYLNPIMQFGVKRFCAECQKAGIDGLIIPDLPLELYDTEFGDVFRQFDLDFVFLITPETKEDRIKQIDQRSTGFIYMVSSSSTTGGTGGLSASQIEYFKRIQSMSLQNKRMIGFGISDKKSFNQAAEFADGAIVGSAFIKQLGKDASKEAITSFIQNIKP